MTIDYLIEKGWIPDIDTAENMRYVVGGAAWAVTGAELKDYVIHLNTYHSENFDKRLGLPVGSTDKLVSTGEVTVSAFNAYCSFLKVEEPIKLKWEKMYMIEDIEQISSCSY